MRRPSAGFVISIALHGVAIALLAQITFGTARLFSYLDRERPDVIVERVEFVALPQPGVEETPGRAGGDGRPVSADPPAPPLIVPRETPAELPPAEPAPPPRAEPGGRGPIIGGGGPLRGIQPAFSDPRLWVTPEEPVREPLTARQRVDSSVVAVIEAYLDSLAALPQQREPGDWTFERGGRRYGIDREYIRLGSISLPTALLALLPLNVQANPIALEREKSFAAMRSDINFHVQQAITHDDFRAAVNRIRERRLREERERSPPRGPLIGGPP
ncbi:MAG TPA: hypothetical protein VMM18_12320 [Gemmatimonadaceae bacterium]|nr:hypothetical protein [Gemmatimonadaceae bacterium]